MHEKNMIVVIHYLETWKHYLMGTKFMVVTDNVANTFFTTQKKLIAKQARQKEFLANFDFEWVHKVGRHNQIVDALIRKNVTEFVGSLSRVMADFTARVKQKASQDFAYNKLVEKVKEGTTKLYWLEDGLLYYMDRKLYVPSNKLRWELLKETHDTKQVGHLEEERTFALISQSLN